MRALAEFIMAGRLKAALVAVGGSLFPFVSPAAVGLVALRRGGGDGLILTLWAILPLLLMRYVSDVSPPMIWASIATVPVVLIAAGALRMGASWAQVLIAAVVLSALFALSMQLVFAAEVEQLRLALAKLFEQMQAGAAAAKKSVMVPTTAFVVGLMAVMIAISAVGSLLLARWWQALLFNPGGFRQEFHALRVDRALAIPLLVGVVGCYWIAPDYMTWGTLLGIPLLVSGIALAHHVIAATGMGAHWLVVFYIALVVMGPASMLVMGLGFCDSLVDFRARLAARGRNGN